MTFIKQHLLFTIAILCLLTSLSFPALATAKIILVPNDYPSINTAIQAAQENDTIRVAAGKYFERITLRPGIILKGSWDSTFTKRDLAASPSILGGSTMGGFSVMGANNTVIDGFVITGGKPPMIAPDALIGPGIYASGITITIKNNIIMANYAAGIYLRTCNATVVSNIIVENGQAGIFLEKNTSATLQGNKISKNFTAGISVGGTELSKITVVNNVLDKNKRAGINAAWATGVIRNNLIYENGHAGIRAVVTPLLIANNTVTNNQLAGISIGDPTVDGTTTDIQTPEIKNNIITHNGEAGIYSNGSGYSYNLLFANNKVNGFHPDFLWYTRLQFAGFEDDVSLEKSKNILADPLFVDPAQHDYHLRPGSPAIDSGDPDVTFNDKNFGPSLGADTNDLGAYGGPFTVAEERPANLAPIADIETEIKPPAQHVYAGDKITLHGEISKDPNGDELSYEWRLLAKPMGSNAALSATTKAKTKLTCDKGGPYRVSLTVTDRWGLRSSPKTMTLRVDSDKPPTAKISKQNNPINVGETVKLSAYKKKKYNGNELNFSWKFLKKPAASRTTLDNAYIAKPTFVLDKPGCYTVQLQVNNGKKDSEPDTTHICSKQTRYLGQRIVPDEYPTIQSALDAAEVNDQIIVNSGVYKEKIIIDKVVDLIGVGWPVIDGGGGDNDDATVFICYLDNMSAGKMQGFVVTGGGAGIFGHGVQILNSSPEIFNNRIRGNKHVGIGIHGHKRFTEKARIHDNFIYDNAIGVSHGLGTYGQIYNNTIYNNKVTGIGVRGLSKPTLRGNTIYNNYVGIGVREEAYPQVEENEIRDNVVGIAINPGTADAVYAEEESRIRIKNNTVYNNQQCGIFISSLHRNGVLTQGNIIENNATDTSKERSGGAVVGYPHESLDDIFLNNNEIRENNGKAIQRFKPLASSYGQVGNSDNRRPF
ncbi:right-handed parallel beta-helix repeat-containing protein [Candidatus Electrothrix sp.]|uniref:right-handed parallel beta-helix repeat-containing protein n=1 Tax=Candidatus Electrothrix sp. TaxID=2170559 RepID=UPI004056FB27